jgi:hypothetical protein
MLTFEKYFLTETHDAYKVGDFLNVHAGKSLIVKNLKDENGIAFVLLKTVDESQKYKGTFLQIDLDSNNIIAHTMYPSYDMAIKKYNDIIDKASKYSTLSEAIKVPFGGYEDYKGKAKVYVNLRASLPKERKLVYSIQGYVPRPDTNKKYYKVIGYNNQLVLGDVKFSIIEDKWKQVQTDGGKKNVHSTVVGNILNEEPKKLSTYITYDPRKYRYFVRFENGTAIPIKAASKVAFNPDGLTADGVIDMEPSEVRPEGALLTPEELYYMQRRKEELKQDSLLRRRKKRFLNKINQTNNEN